MQSCRRKRSLLAASAGPCGDPFAATWDPSPGAGVAEWRSSLPQSRVPGLGHQQLAGLQVAPTCGERGSESTGGDTAAARPAAQSSALEPCWSQVCRSHFRSPAPSPPSRSKAAKAFTSPAAARPRRGQKSSRSRASRTFSRNRAQAFVQVDSSASDSISAYIYLSIFSQNSNAIRL